jgi:hypothetical protein
VYVCVYVYVDVCMFYLSCDSSISEFQKCLCRYVCMCVCGYVCVYVCMFHFSCDSSISEFQKCLRRYVCVYVCMYVCFISHATARYQNFRNVCADMCVCVCVCVCMCVCVYVLSLMHQFDIRISEMFEQVYICLYVIMYVCM